MKGYNHELAELITTATDYLRKKMRGMRENVWWDYKDLLDQGQEEDEIIDLFEELPDVLFHHEGRDRIISTKCVGIRMTTEITEDFNLLVQDEADGSLYELENWFQHSIIGIPDYFAREIEDRAHAGALTYSEWENIYEPIKNNIEPNASVDGFLFDRGTLEWEFVKKNNAARPGSVWTYLSMDGDQGRHCHIVPGIHIVNALGYLVTKQTYAGDEAAEDILY